MVFDGLFGVCDFLLLRLIKPNYLWHQAPTNMHAMHGHIMTQRNKEVIWSHPTASTSWWVDLGETFSSISVEWRSPTSITIRGEKSSDVLASLERLCNFGKYAFGPSRRPAELRNWNPFRPDHHYTRIESCEHLWTLLFGLFRSFHGLKHWNSFGAKGKTAQRASQTCEWDLHSMKCMLHEAARKCACPQGACNHNIFLPWGPPLLRPNQN